jgi:ATP-binding cassette, subfamily F, member 2
MLKMMAGELIPTTGAVRPHPHLRIARYSQHAADALDLEKTPLEFFTGLLPEEPLQEVRKKVGRFGVSGDNQSTQMKYLSGGIRSRLIFALMALKSPHLLLLDEPTNGLDMETIDSLAESIEVFKGGVVLVSHDFRLLNRVAKQIYVVKDRKVTLFKGDMLDFKKTVVAEIEEMEARREAAAAAGWGGAAGGAGKKK